MGNVKGGIPGAESEKGSLWAWFSCAGQIHQIDLLERGVDCYLNSSPEGCHDEVVLLIKSESPLIDQEFLKPLALYQEIVDLLIMHLGISKVGFIQIGYFTLSSSPCP